MAGRFAGVEIAGGIRQTGKAAFLNKSGNIQHVENIHNPSIERHLAPPDKANGMAIVVAAGGGNTTLWVGPEGPDIADWLNSIGISAFVEPLSAGALQFGNRCAGRHAAVDPL